MQFNDGPALTSSPEKATLGEPPPRMMDDVPCIDVDQRVPASKLSTWITNKKYTLLREDQHILLNPAGWLTSSIIMAAQSMLKDQHRGMGGMQDPCLAQQMRFRNEPGKFVQVVHNGFGHWLTITNVGAKNDAEVMVYDSLYPSIGTYIQKQIAMHPTSHHREGSQSQHASWACRCSLGHVTVASLLLQQQRPSSMAPTLKESPTNSLK